MTAQGLYKYETHFHTSYASACARARGSEYMGLYRSLGYDGILVTEHFWRGNCAVDRHLPWDKFVEQFCRGYEETRAAGQRMGIDVFFGWEETFDGDDYLVYGLDKEWLLKHPEARSWTRREQLEQVHHYGGCVVQAHPFRDRDYIPAIHLGLAFADAIEAGNAGNDPAFDVQAHAWARKRGIKMTAGSDIHSPLQYQQKEMMGVGLRQKLHSIHDWVEAIRGDAPVIPLVPEGRFEGRPLKPQKPVWEHQAEGTVRVTDTLALFQ